MIEHRIKQGPMITTLYFSTNDTKHHIVAKENIELYKAYRKNKPDIVTLISNTHEAEQFAQQEIRQGKI